MSLNWKVNYWDITTAEDFKIGSKVKVIRLTPSGLYPPDMEYIIGKIGIVEDYHISDEYGKLVGIRLDDNELWHLFPKHLQKVYE